MLNWKSWNLALAYVDRDTDNTDGAHTNDYNFQVSAGYEFGFGLAVDVGWSIAEESDVETRTVGVLFAYTFEF